MKYLELIQSILSADSTTNSNLKVEILKCWEKDGINEIEVPEPIVQFIQKFMQQLPISKNNFYEFQANLDSTSNSREVVLGMLLFISFKIYSLHAEKLNAFCGRIEDQINNRIGAIDYSFAEATSEMVAGILNVYLIIKLVSNGDKEFNFPEFMQGSINNLIHYDGLFAINALMLAKKIPAEYCSVGFTGPIWPENLPASKTNKIELRSGIKESSAYYPLKRIDKIYVAYTENHTFIATNGKKILYVRGNKKYSSFAVLASKIASYVSSIHFSSERLLDNFTVASRKQDFYSVSLAVDYDRNNIGSYLNSTNTIFTGMGTIDEVLNFVQEKDHNIENFGIAAASTNSVKQHTPMVKIDFDLCDISGKIHEKTYEINRVLTTFLDKYVKHIASHPQYIEEKLLARLKLSLMSPEFIVYLAGKAFVDDNEVDYLRSISALVYRTEIAFNLLLQNEYTKDFFTAHKGVLNILCLEIITYIINHNFNFELEDKSKLISIGKLTLISTIIKRAESLKARIENYFKMDLEPIKIKNSRHCFFTQVKTEREMQFENELNLSEYVLEL